MSPKIKHKVDDLALVEQRRAQLSASAIACFSQRGYHATTIKDVADHAGVSVGLIYQYIEDKEDLLYLALMEVLDSYKRQIPLATQGITDPLERFCATVRGYCNVNGSSVDATVLAYRETKSLRRARRNIIKQKEVETNEIIRHSIQECVRAGLFTQVDEELFTYQIVMFCHAWALKAWRFASRMTVDEYVDRGLRMMLGAVLTPQGARQFASYPWKQVKSASAVKPKRKRVGLAA